MLVCTDGRRPRRDAAGAAVKDDEAIDYYLEMIRLELHFREASGKRQKELGLIPLPASMPTRGERAKRESLSEPAGV